MIYKIIALIILAAFYGCYIAKMISQKKQGINTNQLGKGKQGFVKFIEVSLKAMSWAILAAQLVSIFCNETTLAVPWRVVGLVIAAIGTVVFITAVVTMKNSWRAGVDEKAKTELVTNGIFAYSRNPAFLGFDMLYIGLLLVFFSAWLLIITAVTMLLFHLQIVNVEEDYLITAFGDSYLNYRKKVNRYLGRRK